MKTAEERYLQDAAFRTLTDLIESMLHKAEFTPSEVRECAVLACIHFEMRKPFPPILTEKEQSV